MAKNGTDASYRRGWMSGPAMLLVGGLLALSSGLSPARAIEISQPATNASLAFSPTSVSAGQSTDLCAVNLHTAPVTVAFVLKDPSNSFGDINSPATIPPAGLSCSPGLSLGPGHSPVPILASIVLQSPNECSQAIDYPGKCRVLGSFEISGDVAHRRTRLSDAIGLSWRPRAAEVRLSSDGSGRSLRVGRFG